MSAMPIALLLTSAVTCGVGVAVLITLRALRGQVSALRADLAAGRFPAMGRARVPGARSESDTDEIRAAVAQALADERERELAEARAFWAAQEARDASDARSLLGLSDADPYLPHLADLTGVEDLDPLTESGAGPDDPLGEFAGDSPELAAARRRHPSHPDFTPVPPTRDHHRTIDCLDQLAEQGAELTDVRPGPMGTLDVYLFSDGTTLCMTPGHRETAEKLADALEEGNTPVLLGGSAISGGYTLTFGCGEETVYVLADRVIASL